MSYCWVHWILCCCRDSSGQLRTSSSLSPTRKCLGALYYVLPSRFFRSTSGVIEPQPQLEISYCWVPCIMTVLSSRFFGWTSDITEDQSHSEISYCWVPCITCCRRDFSGQLWRSPRLSTTRKRPIFSYENMWATVIYTNIWNDGNCSLDRLVQLAWFSATTKVRARPWECKKWKIVNGTYLMRIPFI